MDVCALSSIKALLISIRILPYVSSQSCTLDQLDLTIRPYARSVWQSMTADIDA